MRNVTSFAVAAALVGAAAFWSLPAVAGEITGNGRPTAGPEHAASICAFSGLNDHPEGQPGNPGGKTQNYGHTMRMFNIEPRLFNPGDACNPNIEEQ